MSRIAFAYKITHCVSVSYAVLCHDLVSKRLSAPDVPHVRHFVIFKNRSYIKHTVQVLIRIIRMFKWKKTR